MHYMALWSKVSWVWSFGEQKMGDGFLSLEEISYFVHGIEKIIRKFWEKKWKDRPVCDVSFHNHVSLNSTCTIRNKYSKFDCELRVLFKVEFVV